MSLPPRSFAGRDQIAGESAEEPDQKVMEFLKILNEYRLKCEEECKYMEAERA